MPKKDPFNLTRDARGNFKRTLGVKLSEGEYVPHTFYLGRDRAQACVQVCQLEKCWNAVHDRWYRRRETPRACWDATTLEIAKAVGLGKAEVQVKFEFP